ncbi:hypothetical protein EDC01DRAFT_630278 [Geopyxis carbonaria]|nr:hypothetical protein EDC01DRAFT_630278 [Geopyxis carbonaria]
MTLCYQPGFRGLYYNSLFTQFFHSSNSSNSGFALSPSNFNRELNSRTTHTNEDSTGERASATCRGQLIRNLESGSSTTTTKRYKAEKRELTEGRKTLDKTATHNPPHREGDQDKQGIHRLRRTQYKWQEIPGYESEYGTDDDLDEDILATFGKKERRTSPRRTDFSAPYEEDLITALREVRLSKDQGEYIQPVNQVMADAAFLKVTPFSGRPGENIELFFRRFETALRYSREPNYEKGPDGVSLSADGELQRNRDHVILLHECLTGKALDTADAFDTSKYDDLDVFERELTAYFPKPEGQTVSKDEGDLTHEKYLERVLWYKRYLPEEIHDQLAVRFLEGMKDEMRAFSISQTIPVGDFSLERVLTQYRQGFQRRWGVSTGGFEPSEEDEIIGLKPATPQETSTERRDTPSSTDIQARTANIPITTVSAGEWMKAQSTATATMLSLMSKNATTNELLLSTLRAQQNGFDRIASALTAGAGLNRGNQAITNRVFPIHTSESENNRPRRLPETERMRAGQGAAEAGPNQGEPNRNRDTFLKEYQPMSGPGRNKCFNCGEPDHISTYCTNPPLPYAKQQELRDTWNRERQNQRAPRFATGSNEIPVGPARAAGQHVAVNRAAVEESEFDEVEADAMVQCHDEMHVCMALRTIDGDDSSMDDESDEESARTKIRNAMEGLTSCGAESLFEVRINPEEQVGMKRARVDSETGEEADRDRIRRLGTERNPSNKLARVPGGRSARVLTDGSDHEDEPIRGGRTVPKQRDARNTDKPEGEKLKLRPRPRTLEKVQGMMDHDPFDFHRWLTTTRIDMTVLQYLQESPSARRALGWEMSLANPGKRARGIKRKSEAAFDSRQCNIQDLRPSSHFGSFYVTMTVVVGRTRYRFNKVVLDPGSDLNLITPAAVETLGLELTSVKATSMSGVAMRTADGARHRLKSITQLRFHIDNGSWSQEFFLMPNLNECGFSFLLGLPWLYDAWARFDVRNFIYTIQSDEGALIHLNGKAYKPKRYMAVEYPVQVERRINSETGAIREKYVYEESSDNLNYIGGLRPCAGNTSTDDAQSPEVRIMQMAEIARMENGRSEVLGRIPYVDALEYLRNFGDAGLQSEEAKAWVQKSGGSRAADGLIGEFARLMSGN